MALDIIEKIGLSGIGQVLFSIGKIVLIVLLAAIAVGLAIAVGYYFFRPLLYKIECHIYARRHGKYMMIGHDKAKIKKFRTKFFGLFGPIKQTKLCLLKRKVVLPTPNMELLYPTDKMNSPGLLNLLKYGEQDYTPCDVEIDYKKRDAEGNPTGATVKLIPMESDMKNWHLQEIKEGNDRNRPLSWLQEHQVIIAAGLVCLIIFAGFYFANVQFKLVFGTFANSMYQLKDTLLELNRCRV
jgi:hypothetical protein